MRQRFYLALIALSMAAFLVLFIFFLNTFNKTSEPDTLKTNEKISISTPQVNFTDPVAGKKDASNTIVVYGDFQCPYSKEATGIFAELIKNYPEKIKLIWKDFPNTAIHPMAMLASGAAHCAKEQGKFWEYHDYLFENQEKISPSFLSALADELKLDKTEFSDCLQTEKTKPKVQSNLDEARALRLDGTPTIFINGTLYSSKINYENLEMMIK